MTAIRVGDATKVAQVSVAGNTANTVSTFRDLLARSNHQNLRGYSDTTMIIQIDSGEKQMKADTNFASIFLAACILVFLSLLPAFARPANPPQDQGTAQTESVQKGENQKVERSSGKEIGKGGEDVGKGAGKGAESLGKGTAGGAGNLVTLHPGNAAADVGKGAGGAAQDLGVGTAKGAAKVGKGSGKGIGKLGKKIVGKGGKNKNESDNEN
jgi:hypothetical protein